MSQCTFTGCECLGPRCSQYGPREKSACLWDDESGKQIEIDLEQSIKNLEADIDRTIVALKQQKGK